MCRVVRTLQAMTLFDVARFAFQVPPIAIDIPCASSCSIWITLSILISLNPTEDKCLESLKSKSLLPRTHVKLSLVARGPKFYYANISWNISSGKQFFGATKYSSSFPFFSSSPSFLSFFLCFFLFFLSLNFSFIAPWQDLQYAFWRTPIFLSCNYSVLVSLRHGV